MSMECEKPRKTYLAEQMPKEGMCVCPECWGTGTRPRYLIPKLCKLCNNMGVLILDRDKAPGDYVKLIDKMSAFALTQKRSNDLSV
jgi:hypothetical protein